MSYPHKHSWDGLWASSKSSAWPAIPVSAGAANEYCIHCGLLRRFATRPEESGYVYDMGKLSEEALRELSVAYNDPNAPFLPIQILGGKPYQSEEGKEVATSSVTKDAELGALVRRMPRKSALCRHQNGSWSYSSDNWRVAESPNPEGALHDLRETFAERYLHYESLGQLDTPAAREDLYTRALREVGGHDPN